MGMPLLLREPVMLFELLPWTPSLGVLPCGRSASVGSLWFWRVGEKRSDSERHSSSSFSSTPGASLCFSAIPRRTMSGMSSRLPKSVRITVLLAHCTRSPLSEDSGLCGR
uniref:Putative secreted protein n=1 Tax=Ixodes ricinus TaxID=34613 RepID=A0A6B0UJ07_IXORI